jgi:hypothetical protein
MNLTHQASQSGWPGRALELLEEHRPRYDQEDLRSFEWYYLWGLCHAGCRATLRGHTASVVSVAFSPDGETLASASIDGTARIWDVARGQQQAMLQEGGGYAKVAFSPRRQDAGCSERRGDGNLAQSGHRCKAGHTKGRASATHVTGFFTRCEDPCGRQRRRERPPLEPGREATDCTPHGDPEHCLRRFLS